MVDVLIIGAGIAGLTAAIYACRAGKKVLVLEKKAYGGQIIQTYHVGNWPGEEEISGSELMGKIYHHANNLGAEISYDTVLEVREKDEFFEVVGEEKTYETRTVIIATGTIEKPLGLPREEEFAGRGISYCATCDGAFYEGKTVVVVGGGNSALYNALYLADVCRKVYVVHRRAEFLADAVLVEKVSRKGNVEFVMEAQPTEILGAEKLTGLAVTNSDGEWREIAADGIFVAVGKIPDTKALAGLVETDEAGYVKAGEDCLTSRTGIFVAGDCRTKCVRQLITAAADGAVAGNAAAALAGNAAMAVCVDE